MSVIDANITIDVQDEQEYARLIAILQRELTGLTGKETKVNVMEVDDPLSLSPIHLRKLRE